MDERSQNPGPQKAFCSRHASEFDLRDHTHTTLSAEQHVIELVFVSPDKASKCIPGIPPLAPVWEMCYVYVYSIRSNKRLMLFQNAFLPKTN